MAQRPKWWHVLQASKHEAALAVDLYNRSTVARSFEGFVVHMHLAWLYMLHARFIRDDVDFRYRNTNGRFQRVDGEIKTWELASCLRVAYPDEHSVVRCNVEFFIRLRNKIEHRYEQLLAAVVAGKTQAHVLNYEEQLVAIFGAAESMGDSLRFPIFLSSLTPDAVEALKRTHRALPKRLNSFIREFDDALPDEVQGDWRYDFRVLLLPQTGAKTDADAIMRFVREEDMTDEQRRARDVVQTIVRTKQVPVQNKGRHRPGAVASQVQNALGVRFTISAHTAAWKHYRVRPETGAARPENSDTRYCVYDEAHNDYVFTDAWIRKLSRDLADPATFARVTGKPPTPLR
jgi:hypothetical protein